MTTLRLIPWGRVALVVGLIVLGFLLAHLADATERWLDRRRRSRAAEQAVAELGRRPPRQLRRAQARATAKRMYRQVYGTDALTKSTKVEP